MEKNSLKSGIISNFKKAMLIGLLCSVFLIGNLGHAQSKSKEALGNTLVESIVNNDGIRFKSTLLPKAEALKLHEANNLQDIDSKDKDSLMAQYETVYDQKTIPRFEKNLQEMVHLSETNNIDWSKVAFMILYKYASNDDAYLPFLIHTELKNSAYKHFYFEAVRYKGVWYLEGKMELTKGEKYAPK
ncbi:hypothetical protein [Lutimonas sp.]|uniref:hypothetical protein n=1 Tax=Lutimonas sp. TaxID=1872403 RepID=UPI003D9BB5F7